jgi:hypothetical protein
LGYLLLGAGLITRIMFIRQANINTTLDHWDKCFELQFIKEFKDIQLKFISTINASLF